MSSLSGVQVGIDTGCLFTEVIIADQDGVLGWGVQPTSHDIKACLTRALTDALELGEKVTGNKTCMIFFNYISSDLAQVYAQVLCKLCVKMA